MLIRMEILENFNLSKYHFVSTVSTAAGQTGDARECNDDMDKDTEAAALACR